MALTNDDRRQLWADYMSEISGSREPLGGLTKQDLRAVVDAIDEWIDANMASFNSSIPEPARSTLTTRQKVRLFTLVTSRRWEVS